MAMGRGGAKGWGLRPHPTWFYLAPSPPHTAPPRPAPPHMIEKTFSPHPHPLEPCKGLPHLIKLYFLLICLTTSTIFFLIKTYFVNKNILEITTKFIPSNQINF